MTLCLLRAGETVLFVEEWKLPFESKVKNLFLLSYCLDN